MDEQNKTINDNNPYSTYGVLAFVSTIIDKFPSIKEYVASSAVNTATLFVPQSLSYLDGDISRNPGLIHDAYLLLDMVNLYSFEVYTDPNTVIDNITNSIITTRYVPESDFLLAEEAIDAYTITDAVSFSSLIANNKIILAIYIYLLTVSIM